ncbi:hypothetical protein ACH5RR_008847 [Cinchona calisaya]|uniref:Protein FAR1-RELATED SEQUENCE n=1 Tax=Cinchona calisaya TaxID=153742 RepID=A0ABD3AG44_9GENT
MRMISYNIFWACGKMKADSSSFGDVVCFDTTYWKNNEDNDWLKRMFELKEKRALVYGRETFCTDMTTTQRSESMNSVIKRYTSYKNKFEEFFNNFQRLLDDRRYEEIKADFKASTSTPVLPFDIEVLKKAASIYTPEVFKWFQTEWGKSIDCALTTCGEIGTVTEYKILCI